MNKPSSLSILRGKCNPKPYPRASILRNLPLWRVAGLPSPLPEDFPQLALMSSRGIAVGAKVFFP